MSAWPQILLGCLVLGFTVGVVFQPFSRGRRSR